MKAFASICDLCGHELAGVTANRTIENLVDRFHQIEVEVNQAGIQGRDREKEIALRKARVIRDFPIPNSREDLQSLIYFIHPKIQDNIKPDPNAEDWRVKFREVLNLAKVAYKGDAKIRAQFEEIETSLNTTLSGSLQTQAKRYPVVALGVGLVMTLAVAGLGVSQYEKWKLKQCEAQYDKGAATEKSRLDSILLGVNAKLRDKSFTDALSSLNQLRWEYKASCREEDSKQEQVHWEEKRKEMLAIVQQSETKEEGQKRDDANRAEAQKRDEADRLLAEKISEKAKAASAARKAASDKEW